MCKNKNNFQKQKQLSFYFKNPLNQWFRASGPKNIHEIDCLENVKMPDNEAITKNSWLRITYENVSRRFGSVASSGNLGGHLMQFTPTQSDH